MKHFSSCGTPLYVDLTIYVNYDSKISKIVDKNETFAQIMILNYAKIRIFPDIRSHTPYHEATVHLSSVCVELEFIAYIC